MENLNNKFAPDLKKEFFQVIKKILLIFFCSIILLKSLIFEISLSYILNYLKKFCLIFKKFLLTIKKSYCKKVYL